MYSPSWNGNAKGFIDVNDVIPGLNPNISKTVHWLRDNGFSPTDSGDGTNFEAGMEGALKEPHVFMTVSKENAFKEADRLGKLIEALLLDKKPLVEMSYSPLDGVVVLAVIGLDDKTLFGEVYEF